MSIAKISLWFSSPLLLAVAACGGSVSNNAADAQTDATDAVSSDSVPTDSAGDSPVVRTPKNHRATASTCSPSTSPGTGVCSGGIPGACKIDSDCAAGKNGHCEPLSGGVLMCGCVYDTCASDTDCKGSVCACQGTPYQTQANTCAPAGGCRLDSDCGAGGFCSPSSGAGCANAIAGYFCHTAADECVDDEDCKSGVTGPANCRFDGAKHHWACAAVLACG
jgi:hypothetical protein